MHEWIKRFFEWYQKHEKFNLGFAAVLFSLQIIHLIWLTSDVVWMRLFGYGLLNLTGAFEWFVILVDFTEIPALISTSLVYINFLRKKFSWKNVWFLFFLNIQLIHIFWITDEFVVQQFTNPIGIPVWVAWIAIFIDYLELPVIIETLKLFIQSLKKGQVQEAFVNIKEKE